MPNNVIRQIELEMQRQAIASLLVLAILFALAMWVAFHVIRVAVREGIKESGLVAAVRAQRTPGNDPATWDAAVRAARTSNTERPGPDTIPGPRTD
jgi:hypothetical protein